VAQAGVGYLQYFNGLPAILVGIHVAGATAVFAASVGVLLGCRTPDPAPVTVAERRNPPAVPVG
jgi:cytochrome c oxidase assembly protein subunit 15